MKPSSALETNRLAVLKLVARYPFKNPRIFGSVPHGTDLDGSDLDFMVDTLPGATLLDLGDLQAELRILLGINVDLLTPGDLPLKIRPQIPSEAQPI
jgi:uncharacterized protein